MNNEVPGHGGRREGAGRKSANEVANDFAVARARKEAALADKAELEVGELAGELIRRVDVASATAVAYASFVQAMRSLGDVLERDHGLSPEQAEAVSNHIDDALASLGRELKQMHEATKK